MQTSKIRPIRLDAAPTEVQMKLAIAQLLSLPSTYNTPVFVLDFDVDDNGGITGHFRDSTRPRIFSFEIDDSGISFSPFVPQRSDSLSTEEWEDFSEGYSYRFDVARQNRTDKPKCNPSVSYSCGKSCISLKKTCRTNPKDPVTVKKKENVIEGAKAYKKAKKTTSAKEKVPVEKKVKAKKTTSAKEKVPVEKEVKTKTETKQAKIPKTESENIPKDSSAGIGDGTHDGAPKNAQEYYDMVTKSGGKITKEEAEGTIKAIEKWGFDSNFVRDVQKAGKSSKEEQYITDFINNSTPYKGELYRGLSIYMDNPRDLIKVGQPLGNQGAHASWTSKPQVAEYFADTPDDYHYSVVIKSINNKTGASIRNIAEERQGGFMGMEEVIVPKNAKHIVRSIKEIRKDVFFVEVEEV